MSLEISPGSFYAALFQRSVVIVLLNSYRWRATSRPTRWWRQGRPFRSHKPLAVCQKRAATRPLRNRHGNIVTQLFRNASTQLVSFDSGQFIFARLRLRLWCRPRRFYGSFDCWFLVVIASKICHLRCTARLFREDHWPLSRRTTSTAVHEMALAHELFDVIERAEPNVWKCVEKFRAFQQFVRLVFRRCTGARAPTGCAMVGWWSNNKWFTFELLFFDLEAYVFSEPNQLRIKCLVEAMCLMLKTLVKYCQPCRQTPGTHVITIVLLGFSSKTRYADDSLEYSLSFDSLSL